MPRSARLLTYVSREIERERETESESESESAEVNTSPTIDHRRLLELIGAADHLYSRLSVFWAHTDLITETEADSSVTEGGQFIGAYCGGHQVYAWAYRVDLDTRVGERPRAIRPMFTFGPIRVQGPVLYAHWTTEQNKDVLRSVFPPRMQ